MGQSTGVMTRFLAPSAAPHCMAGRCVAVLRTHDALVTHQPHDVSVMHARHDAYCAQLPLLNGSRNSDVKVCKVQSAHVINKVEKLPLSNSHDVATLIDVSASKCSNVFHFLENSETEPT